MQIAEGVFGHQRTTVQPHPADHFIMKIRMVRFLRTPEFDSLFSGDPIWATEVIGGMGLDGRTLVTKNSFRYLHTCTLWGRHRNLT
ncbi:formate acetyltransferase [Shigella flexneri]|nr:formate acetyltransferase [Shigella flexneri]